VCEKKLRLFLYIQYIIVIYVSLAFQKCTQVRGHVMFTSNMQKM